MLKNTLVVTLGFVLHTCWAIKCNNTEDADYAIYLQYLAFAQQAKKLKEEAEISKNDVANLEGKITSLEKEHSSLQREQTQLSQELAQLLQEEKQNKNSRSTGSGITTWINCCTSWVKNHLYPDCPELIALRQENTTLQQKNAELKQLKAALQQEHAQQQEKNATLEKQLTKARPTLLDPPE